MLQIQGGLLNAFFKQNGFCVNLLTRTFRIKNDKYPKKARVVGGGGIFPINSVQCLVKKSSDPSKCEPKNRHEEPQEVIFLHGIWRHIKEFGIEGQIPRISSPVKLEKWC